MRLRDALLAGILLSLAGLLAGCERLETPGPWPVSPKPTLSPTPALVWPTAVPSGPMPGVLAEVDLGLPQGDAYGPAALALSQDALAYVLCQHMEEAEHGQAGISVVDLESGQVRDVWRLPGQSTGPLVVGDDRLYVYYQTEVDDLLGVLDLADGAPIAEVSIEPIALRPGMWIDAPRRRLYLALDGGIQVRDALNLETLAWLPYPLQTIDRQAALDPQQDRLYLGLSARMVAYRAADLNKLWEVQVPAQWVERIVLDASGERLIVQARIEQGTAPESELLVYNPDGDLLTRISPKLEARPWEIVWADWQAGHLVASSISYAVRRPARLALWGLDLEGQIVAGPSIYWGGLPASGARRHDLFVLDGRGQRLHRLDGASLQRLSSAILGVQIADLAFDAASLRLLASDTAGMLHQLDARNLAGGVLTETQIEDAGAGPIAWLPDLEILLVGARDGDCDQVSVLESASLHTAQVITGGDRIAVDTRRSRAILGSYVNPAAATPSGQVAIWDLARQEPVGAIAPGGAPAYNPLRDEIYVARRGVDIYDANTLDRLGSLTPDIEAQSCLGCTGQPAVSDVHVYSDRGLIWLEMSLIGAGRGGGVLPAPRLFALDTRQPLSLTLTALPTWDDRPLLWPPVRQRVYQNVYSARDVQHANLIVRNAQGTRIDWRDGLQLEWLSPAGELAYVPWGDRWLALDTVTWQPVGATTRFAVHSYLPDHDVLLAAQNATVLALAPDRGQPLPTEPAEAAVPTGAIQTLAISPEYGSDSTCFAVSDGTLYRSRDRGASWARLGAGLPRAKGLGGRQLAMALSPAFDLDRTLFVGGWEGEQGLGLWGSRDAGDTWEPLWRGLEHLRIEEIFFSPAYSSDRTVWALCRWHDVLAATSGRSLFRSTDAGETWALSAQTDEQSDEAAWPQIAPLVRERDAPWARAIKGGRAVEVGEGEKAHTTLSLPLGELIVEQRQAEDGVLYLLTSLSLYRSTDGGEHWELALGAAFEGRRATQSFTALATWGDGERQTLFLGDRVGQVQILEASELKWGAVS